MKKYLVDKLKTHGLTTNDFYIEIITRGKRYNIIFYSYSKLNLAYNKVLARDLQNVGYIVKQGNGINIIVTNE